MRRNPKTHARCLRSPCATGTQPAPGVSHEKGAAPRLCRAANRHLPAWRCRVGSWRTSSGAVWGSSNLFNWNAGAAVRRRAAALCKRKGRPIGSGPVQRGFGRSAIV